MSLYTILIVEDEPTINRMVSNYFKAENFNVLSAFTGVEGLKIFNHHPIDLVILDIMMPGTNGWEIARKIREVSAIPIIMMSALGEEEDILKGYSLRVDDYITKPFNPKVLVAKTKNLLERIKNQNHSIIHSGIIKTNHLLVNTNTHKIFVDDKELELSKTEFDLLKYFVEHEGKICSRNHLLDEVWGIDVYVEDRIVDTYVKKLRKHLGPYSSYIKTVFGVGYRFEAIDE
jgi:two-component system response regulator VanR